MRVQAGFDITQTFAVSQLRKGQTQKLLETREALGLVLAVVAGDTASKRRQRQVLGQLGENELSFVHVNDPQKNDFAGAQLSLMELKSRAGQTTVYIAM